MARQRRLVWSQIVFKIFLESGKLLHQQLQQKRNNPGAQPGPSKHGIGIQKQNLLDQNGASLVTPTTLVHWNLYLSSLGLRYAMKQACYAEHSICSTKTKVMQHANFGSKSWWKPEKYASLLCSLDKQEWLIFLDQQPHILMRVAWFPNPLLCTTNMKAHTTAHVVQNA